VGLLLQENNMSDTLALIQQVLDNAFEPALYCQPEGDQHHWTVLAANPAAHLQYSLTGHDTLEGIFGEAYPGLEPYCQACVSGEAPSPTTFELALSPEFRLHIRISALAEGLVLHLRQPTAVTPPMTDESPLQILAQHTEQGLMEWHVRTGETYFSPQMQRLLGWDQLDIHPHIDLWFNAMQPQERSELHPQLIRWLEEGRTELRHQTVFMSHGVSRPLRCRGWVQYQDNQPVRVTYLFSDLSSLAQARAELVAQQDLLDLFLRASDDGFWDWDLENNRLYFSSRWKEMLGYQNQELPNLWTSWHKVIAPEDQEKASQLIQAFNSGEIPEFKAEIRCRHKSGKNRWIWMRAMHQRNSHGKVVRMVGVGTDITTLRVK
jgi:PAS domain S-box-containing protein